MTKSILLTIILLSIGSFNLFSQSARRLQLGTPQSILNDLQNQHARTTSSYSLPLSTGEIASINLENYYYSADGELSMNGTAQESPNSLFILKGDRSSLYGYLALRDSKKAYEITTTDGVTSIEEVDIALIFPDLYETGFKPPVDNDAPLATVLPVYSPMAKRQAIHIGKYNNEDVTKLQSKPGCPYVFYLNHSAVMDGDTPKNGNSKESMFRVWQCVADQYSMLNMNITTDPAIYNAAKAKDVLKTASIKFVDEDGRSFACIGCFGTTSTGTLYRNSMDGDYGYGIGMTCAHETGHQMGLHHDGGSEQSDPEYFFGLPAVQWCPTMGNYWYGGSWQNQLFTWSKGEYNTATNTEDDYQIMTTKAKVPYVVDDNPSGKALKISAAGIISSDDNWGQIEKNTDSDAFTFQVGSNGGKMNLKIDPIEYLRQLDVAAKIVDSKGTTIASSNLAKNRSAEFKDLSLAADTYSLIIQGGAELTPQTGFSNYSSLGYYAMEGTLTGAVVTSIGKTSLDNSIAVFPNPATDVLNISYGFNKTATQVYLMDMTGKIIYQSNQQLQILDLSNFAKGIYFLKITVDGESCVKRVSKL